MSWAPLSTTIPDLAVCRGETLLVLILFKFGLSTSLGWKDRVDHELSNVGFMEVLQLTGVLKAIFSSRNLQNYHDMFNLLHLVRLWCSVTHTFFLSYGKLTVTLEDMANQLLLPILGDIEPSDIQLSTDAEAMEVEVRKGLGGGNAKLSNQIMAFTKASTTTRHASFIVFGLCKFVFGSHPHFAIKPVYF